MKKIFLILIIACLLIATGFAKPINYSLPLIGKLIIIDPGHGGKDPGTVYRDVYEKNLNLAISLKLADVLNKKGASTILIRNDDYDLSKPNATYRKKSDFDNRIKIINSNNADMYLSIHLNYLQLAQYYGGQVFYNTKNKSNLQIASTIQNSFNMQLKSNRSIKLIPTDNYMYKNLKVPGVLIECGFLSNPSERKKIQTKEYQYKIAETIVNGIINYYSS